MNFSVWLPRSCPTPACIFHVLSRPQNPTGGHLRGMDFPFLFLPPSAKMFMENMGYFSLLSCKHEYHSVLQEKNKSTFIFHFIHMFLREVLRVMSFSHCAALFCAGSHGSPAGVQASATRHGWTPVWVQTRR